MNLNKLFDMQKELDAKIVREKGLEGKDLLPQKILALQVELGECANEWRGFKFWSTNQERKKPQRIKCERCGGHGISVTSRDVCPDCEGYGWNGTKYPLLEEYVDCLHFILSIGLTNDLYLECEPFLPGRGQDITQTFLRVMEQVVLLHNDVDAYEYQNLLEHFFVLGYSLGFNYEQIEQAYYAKNEVNHQRQATGY